ncbi:MAG: ROK family protein [Sciscionella sp.]
MDARCVIAVDVGGTCMKAALVDEHAVPLVSRRVPTGAAEGPQAVMARVAATVEQLRRVAIERARTPVAVGVVVPGVVDETAGVAVFAANLGWRDLPVRALLERRSALPIAFGHDVRAGAAAEGVLGAARGVADFLFLPIGTGIAGAIVLDGRPYAAGGWAGELGHVVVAPGGRCCGCGGRGCLETVASAAAVAARYAEAGGPSVDAEEVLRRAAGDDPLAAAVLHDAATALAMALAMYVSVLAPQLIVVGGGLAAAGNQLLDPLATLLSEQLSFQRAPKLVTAALGERAGCLGAALLAWRRVEDRVRS